jgi:hypothetical protein
MKIVKHYTVKAENITTDLHTCRSIISTIKLYIDTAAEHTVHLMSVPGYSYCGSVGADTLDTQRLLTLRQGR